MPGAERNGGDPVGTARVNRWITSAAIEVLPLDNAAERIGLLPVGSTVTVTSSPKLGTEATISCAVAAAAAGMRPVPHLAARQISGDAELGEIVTRLRAAGIDSVFVIGGDNPSPAGDYRAAGDLLEGLERLGHRFASVGIGAYPEGHPKIDDEELWRQLARKQPHADYLVTQMCFDASALLDWLDDARSRGIDLPARIGVAGPLKVRKLVTLSTRIGVGASLSFLTKQQGFVSNALLGGSYRPDELLGELDTGLGADDRGIAGLHLYSFNQTADLVAWQESHAQPV